MFQSYQMNADSRERFNHMDRANIYFERPKVQNTFWYLLSKYKGDLFRVLFLFCNLKQQTTWGMLRLTLCCNWIPVLILESQIAEMMFGFKML